MEAFGWSYNELAATDSELMKSIQVHKDLQKLAQGLELLTITIPLLGVEEGSGASEDGIEKKRRRSDSDNADRLVKQVRLSHSFEEPDISTMTGLSRMPEELEMSMVTELSPTPGQPDMSMMTGLARMPEELEMSMVTELSPTPGQPDMSMVTGLSRMPEELEMSMVTELSPSPGQPDMSMMTGLSRMPGELEMPMMTGLSPLLGYSQEYENRANENSWVEINNMA